jgi:fibronectin type III domain protein
VAEVAEEVALTDPSADGQLQIGAPPGQGHSVMNFAAGSGTSVSYDDSVLTELSAGGQEAITNTSSASVTVQVAAVGYYQDPTAPAAPTSANATVSGTSATITWATPPADGGSPITGYTVTASPDTATTTVDGGTYQAILTGLAHASTDTFAITATNATGTSGAATYTPSTPTTVSGTVLAPSGSPAAGVPVNIDTADPPTDTTTDWTPDQLGTTTTDANGNWSFTVPPYSSLPADAQQEAANNGGTLNVDAEAYGQAVTAGTTYFENDSAEEAVWVGSGTGGTPAAGVSPQPQQMTLAPEGPDNSALDTSTAETQTWSYQNAATTTDSSGQVVDDSASDSPPPTDPYGYQSIGPDNNYSPNIAYDGTDLTDVPVSGIINGFCAIDSTTVLNTWWQWTKVGTTHSGWNNSGDFWYGHGGSTSIGIELSADGDHFKLGGSVTWTHGSSSKWDWGERGPNDSRYAYLAFNYAKLKIRHGCYTNQGYEYKHWFTWERREKGGLHNFSNSPNYEYGSTNIYSQADGPNNLPQIENQHSSYISTMRRGTTFEYDWSTTQDFGTAVEIGGIGVDAETSLDTETEQEIHEHDGTHYLHKIWSWHGNPESCNCRLRVVQSR